jgi:hypothetical protein
MKIHKISSKLRSATNGFGAGAFYFFIYYFFLHDISNEANVEHMGETRNVYKTLVEKPEGNRPPGRPSCVIRDLIHNGKSV